MNNLRTNITEIINEYNIKDLIFLRLNEYQNILYKLADTFLKNGRKDLENFWFWGNYRTKEIKASYENNFKALKHILDLNETYYFIASEENGKYWVLKGTGEAISNVSEKCIALSII